MALQASNVFFRYLVFSSILTAHSSYGQDSSPYPFEYCFDQFSARGNYSNLIIDYNLLIDENSLYKAGDIFVGAGLKSDPLSLFLSNAFDWEDYSQNMDMPTSYRRYLEFPQLVPISVFRDPQDLSAAIGDGEIWVGYGLRPENGTSKDSFEDMIEKKRYKLIWSSTPAAPSLGFTEPFARICLTATNLSRNVITVGIDLPDPNDPKPVIPAEDSATGVDSSDST